MQKELSFEFIANRFGVPSEKIPILTALYANCKEDIKVLRSKVSEESINNLSELAALFIFHGAVEKKFVAKYKNNDTSKLTIGT